MARTSIEVCTHLHECEDCHKIKMCFEGTRVGGGEPARTFYRCLDCDNELVDRYEASLSGAATSPLLR
jgi:DNA-directed RNA polymerase subunit M/transcription elongation factor TFIIS